MKGARRASAPLPTAAEPSKAAPRKQRRAAPAPVPKPVTFDAEIDHIYERLAELEGSIEMLAQGLAQVMVLVKAKRIEREGSALVDSADVLKHAARLTCPPKEKGNGNG